jgi:hypothetical protein
LPAWEELFRSLSSSQQQEILALAQRQGLIYAQQIPPSNNGQRIEQSHPLLPRLLAGHCDPLEPVSSSSVDVYDSELDLVQREAVSKALAAPDIFLLQGLPGTGKSRVVAEIIVQAAKRNERVLLLARSTAALDRILQWVAPQQMVFALRCLDVHELPETLPAASRPSTYPERAQFLNSQLLAYASREIEASDARCLRLGQLEPSWPRLTELAAAIEQLSREIQALEEQQSRLAFAVESEAAAAEIHQAVEEFPLAIRERRRRLEEELNRLDGCLADSRQQLNASRQALLLVSGELDFLESLAQAKRKRRWWTRAWWRAILGGYSEERRTQGESRRQQLQTRLDALEKEIATLNRQREQAENVYQSERSQIIQAELARRRLAFDQQLEALRPERALLEQKWQAAFAGIDQDSTKPAEMTVDAVTIAQAAWARQLAHAREQHLFAQQWAAHLETSKQTLASRWQEYVNLVAATITGLAADPHFGDRAAAGASGTVPFDLLIVEDADQVTDSELLRAARRASRCVLVGQSPWEPTEGEARERTQPPTSAFGRLWELLHCDPRRLPYAWVKEQERWCCRLRPVAPDQRQWLESECVADHPDIELRILTLPRSQPMLAEVVFPLSMTIDQAKEYIFRELQELAVEASNHSLRWLEETNRLVLRLADCQLTHHHSVALERGVSERLSSRATSADCASASLNACQTCCLEFDRTSGWDRPQAEKWAEQYLGFRDLGRTVRLDVIHRMGSGLVAFVAGILGATADRSGHRNSATRQTGSGGCVEFVPVPSPLKVENPGHRREPGRKVQTSPPAGQTILFSRKGGAGLELDLSDPRQRERLPSEYRGDFFSRGFVNYPEAQAVVRVLTALAKESPLPAGAPTLEQPVVVLALYPAQAELIRRMIHRVPQLAGFTVTVPAAYVQGEAEIVLLSLTRSHTHRAVAFGDRPEHLAVALSRARSKLIIFGDPGTLARRSQWEGPLEHLDPFDAARERALIGHLFSYLNGHGLHPHTFHLRQDSGS